MSNATGLCGAENADYPGEYACTYPADHGPIPDEEGTEWAHADPNRGAWWNAAATAPRDTLTARLHEALLREHFGEHEPHPAYRDPDSDLGRQARRLATYVTAPDPNPTDSLATQIEDILAEQRCRDVHGDAWGPDTVSVACHACRSWADHVAKIIRETDAR